MSTQPPTQTTTPTTADLPVPARRSLDGSTVLAQLLIPPPYALVMMHGTMAESSMPAGLASAIQTLCNHKNADPRNTDIVVRGLVKQEGGEYLVLEVRKYRAEGALGDLD